MKTKIKIKSHEMIYFGKSKRKSNLKLCVKPKSHFALNREEDIQTLSAVELKLITLTIFRVN